MRSLHAGVSLGLGLGLAGCALNLGPAIGRNLPSDPAQAQRVFDQRVRQRYPIGSSEAALIDDMRVEGFGIATNSQSPPDRFSKFAIQCGYISIATTHGWEIEWSAANGRLTDIAGVFMPQCH